jgi:hypothetical protein
MASAVLAWVDFARLGNAIATSRRFVCEARVTQGPKPWSA